MSIQGKMINHSEGQIKVSFGYQCNSNPESSYCGIAKSYENTPAVNIQRTSSFSCLSGAALSANATLANTNICNGLIGAEKLPTWDSPNSFRRVLSSPSLFKLDLLSSSLQSTISNLSCSPSTASNTPEYDSFLKSMSAPSRSEGFLNSMEVQVAGGAAGEDRVQAVCSEENGWLFCGIYDGFNGRDAADFLAGTLYETITLHFNLLDWEAEEEFTKVSDGSTSCGSFQCTLEANNTIDQGINLSGIACNKDSSVKGIPVDANLEEETSSQSFRLRVLGCLQRALNQAEKDFLYMVEQEMEDRPDLVSVGSCVLVVLLHGSDLYTLNLGDSRAVLATCGKNDVMDDDEGLQAFQLNESHTVDNEVEREKLVSDHPDDPATIVGGKVKGKLNVTRAFGVGYLKKKKLNDALMGILGVRNLISPPYVSTRPSLNVHRISKADQFIIVASDGLFDFFSNDEAVKLVHSYITRNPSCDPAKFLLEQLVIKAADNAGFSMEQLMRVPAGRRRKYHDDVTVIVVMLGTNQRTTKASTRL